jgi:hypothetical protein
VSAGGINGTASALSSVTVQRSKRSGGVGSVDLGAANAWTSTPHTVNNSKLIARIMVPPEYPTNADSNFL